MLAGAGQVGRLQGGHHREVLIVRTARAGGTRVGLRSPGEIGREERIH